MALPPQQLQQHAHRLYNEGKLTEAEQCYIQLLELMPENPDFLNGMAVILQAQGKNQESVPFMQRAIAIQPSNPAYRLNLANALLELEQPHLALEHLTLALQAAPASAEFYNALGMTHSALGLTTQAIESYQKAISHSSQAPSGYINLGALHQTQGDYERAIATYLEGIQHNPANAKLHNNLSLAYLALYNVNMAIEHLQQALVLQPGYFEARNNLATAYKHAGRVEQAIASYMEVLTTNPRYTEAYYNLGLVLQEQKRYAEALACYQQALTLNPDYAQAQYNLGHIHIKLDQLDQAAAWFERILQRNPEHTAALNSLINLRQHICRWDGLTQLQARQLTLLHHQPDASITPFSLLSTPSSPEDQLLCARQWVANHLQSYINAGKQLGFSFAGRSHKRIRVGYLSADLHEHATAYLIAELFELHDRTKFEIYAYSYGTDDRSQMRQRLTLACDHFIDIQHDSHINAAKRIYQDEIDILVDLKGYTEEARDQILALRPAPVQVSWLGYPGTMGAEFIDYIIADNVIIPPEHEHYYSERVIRMPDCYQINDRKRPISPHPYSRQDHGLPERGVVFCSLNQSYKITAAMFDCWMEILHQVPESVLWLMASNRWAVENLCREATQCGISPQRLIFAEKRPLNEHLARYRHADLFLDTYPVNAHTTASDALWAGCPLITISGQTFASRVAGSLLHSIGLDELITADYTEYRQLAIKLASQPALIDYYRAIIVNKPVQHALFDSPTFVRHLEQHYIDFAEGSNQSH